MNVTIDLPPWAIRENANLPSSIETVEERMRTVIRFSALNVQHQTGGPFAAGVFERRPKWDRSTLALRAYPSIN